MQEEFVDKGIDSIAYRKDLLDALQMVDVLEHYPRLNKPSMKLQSIWFKGVYDTYDSENGANAVIFLLNSLEAKLKKKIQDKKSVGALFVDGLFILLDTQRPASADQFVSIIEQIKSIHPKDFKGEDIEKCAAASSKVARAGNGPCLRQSGQH